MNSSQKTIVGSLARATSIAAAACLLVIPVQATILFPGSVLIPSAAEADPAGGVIVATSVAPFSVPGAFSGQLFSDVIAGDASNPLGGLTFVFRVAHDGISGPNSIGRLSLTDYSGFLTDASYQPFAGIAPGSIDRGVAGNTIGFNFIPTPIDPLSGFLAPGTSSARLVIQTDAPAYVPSLAFLIDGGITSVATFGPAVRPERVPDGASTALLFGVAVTALVQVRRRYFSRLS